jgi:catechol 2,3-dioxygenase-like lactoylglutathione lyase family enzyme
MIDHVTLRVRDLAAAKSFYSTALAPLGYKVGMEFPDGAGLGAGEKLDFWIIHDPDARPQHLAFSAPDRASVDAFHAAALAAGGSDNGPPGLRLEYHPNYYASFVLDPSGHNMEAVHHHPPGAARKPAAKKVAKGPKGVASRITRGPKGLARKPKARKITRGPKGLTRKLKAKRIIRGPKG